MTAVVFRHDVIPQTGIRNLFLLRQQLVQCYARCQASKWDVLAASLSGDLQTQTALFTGDATANNPTSLNSPNNPKNSNNHFDEDFGEKSDIIIDMKRIDTQRLSNDLNQLSDPSLSLSTMDPRSLSTHLETSMSSDDLEPHNLERENSSFSDPTDPAELKMLLKLKQDVSRKQDATVTGQIYHLWPTQGDSSWCPHNLSLCSCDCKSPPPEEQYCGVYPVAAETFKEIICDKSMFADHLPGNYLMQNVHIPDEIQLEINQRQGLRRRCNSPSGGLNARDLRGSGSIHAHVNINSSKKNDEGFI